MAKRETVVQRVAATIYQALGMRSTAGELAEALQDAGLLAVEYETVKEANANGVYVGTLANGDTFGDEDAVYVPKRARGR
jgi:hypothetical protein